MRFDLLRTWRPSTSKLVVCAQFHQNRRGIVRWPKRNFMAFGNKKSRNRQVKTDECYHESNITNSHHLTREQHVRLYFQNVSTNIRDIWHKFLHVMKLNFDNFLVIFLFCAVYSFASACLYVLFPFFPYNIFLFTL